MSRRKQIVLRDPVDDQLIELAAASDMPPATLAAHFVESCVAKAAKEGKVRPERPTTPSVSSHGGERPAYLEPYGGDPDWRRQMWGAIVALHGRYPEQLKALKDKWWASEYETEMLCALAVWRGELDEGPHDPREEIAFHHQISDYGRTLSQQGGGVTKAWKPGGIPPEWASASSEHKRPAR